MPLVMLSISTKARLLLRFLSMSEMELVPDDMSKKELRREANWRAHKAGYRVTPEGKLKPLRIMVNGGAWRTKLNMCHAMSMEI